MQLLRAICSYFLGKWGPPARRRFIEKKPGNLWPGWPGGLGAARSVQIYRENAGELMAAWGPLARRRFLEKKPGNLWPGGLGAACSAQTYREKAWEPMAWRHGGRLPGADILRKSSRYMDGWMDGLIDSNVKIVETQHINKNIATQGQHNKPNKT